MNSKMISSYELKKYDVFRLPRETHYEYIYLGAGKCLNKQLERVERLDIDTGDVEYIGNMKFSPYVSPSWRSLLVPHDVDYDILTEFLDEKGIEWQVYPRGLFPREVVQVRDDDYRNAQILRGKARRATDSKRVRNLESEPLE